MSAYCVLRLVGAVGEVMGELVGVHEALKTLLTVYIADRQFPSGF